MQYLSEEQLQLELRRRPGLVPIDIAIQQRELIWADLENYHLYEGFFHRGLNNFAALKHTLNGQPLETFATALTVLTDRLIVDSIYPTAFIFHAGRCGSTLLARILARDRRHLVIGEAAAHNQFWLTLTDNAEGALSITDEMGYAYRNLLLAMGRKRLPAYEKHFIKFTSFNILFFNFIRSVFPDVPAVFLYREPLDIVASFAKSPPAWSDQSQEPLRRLFSRAAVDAGKSADHFGEPATAVAAFFAAGLRAEADDMRYLNYADLKPENLTTILSALNIDAAEDKMATMRSQFNFDSKVDNRALPFLPRTKVSGAPSINEPSRDTLKQLYDQLVGSRMNVIPPA